MENRFLELFNWRISRFLAIGYLRALYLLGIISTVGAAGFYEYAIARSTTESMGHKVGYGLVVLSVLLTSLLILRVFMEFLIAIFYIESHLRVTVGLEDVGDIE